MFGSREDTANKQKKVFTVSSQVPPSFCTYPCISNISLQEEPSLVYKFQPKIHSFRSRSAKDEAYINFFL